MHCGGTVEPWKRTHVHQPRDFISHWKSTANAARGGGQSLAAFRCVRMWNAKCERAAQPEQQQARASLRCAALPCVALRCNLLCRRRRRRLLKCPPPTTTTTRQIAENCQRQWFSSIAFIVLECEREREKEMCCMRGCELKSACMCAWMGGSVCECECEWGTVVWFYFHCQLLYTPVSMQYAHTHMNQYICIERIDSTSILGLIDSSVKCASAYLAPSWK